MVTSQILPFRALAVGDAFMYEGRCWVKLSSSCAAYLGSTERAHFNANTPVEVY